VGAVINCADNTGMVGYSSAVTVWDGVKCESAKTTMYNTNLNIILSLTLNDFFACYTLGFRIFVFCNSFSAAVFSLHTFVTPSGVTSISVVINSTGTCKMRDAEEVGKAII